MGHGRMDDVLLATHVSELVDAYRDANKLGIDKEALNQLGAVLDQLGAIDHHFSEDSALYKQMVSIRQDITTEQGVQRPPEGQREAPSEASLLTMAGQLH